MGLEMSALGYVSLSSEAVFVMTGLTSPEKAQWQRQVISSYSYGTLVQRLAR